MLHPDGIEVYLKPMGAGSDEIKYAEFSVTPGGDRYPGDFETDRRTTVLARGERFQVVVQCHSKFNMNGSSALITDVNDGYKVPVDRSAALTSAFPRCEAHYQHVMDAFSTYCSYSGRSEETLTAIPYQMGNRVKGE